MLFLSQLVLRKINTHSRNQGNLDEFRRSFNFSELILLRHHKQKQIQSIFSLFRTINISIMKESEFQLDESDLKQTI